MRVIGGQVRRATAVPCAAVGALAASCVATALWIHYGDHGWRAIDLEVYRVGGRALLRGHDIYSAHPVGSGLSFTYPPFAAVSFAPVSLAGPVVARVAVTALSVLALLVCAAVALRVAVPACGPRARWTVAALVAAVCLYLEPVHSTLGFGQVNLLLMALVMLDVLGPRGRVPQGVLLGLATAVKLTPGIFVLYFLVTGRRHAARNAAGVTAGSMLLGFAVAPASSWRYWTELVFDPHRVGGIGYAGNQSLRGVVARLSGGPHEAGVLWVLAALAVLAVGLGLAARAARAGDELLGVGLCAVTGLLVSPISWNHHWVWSIPLAVLLWARVLRLRVPGRVAAATAWTALFSLGPIWWAPFEDDREYGHHGWELLAGNAYVLAGLVLLAAAPLLLGPTGPGGPGGPGGSDAGHVGGARSGVRALPLPRREPAR